MFNFSEKIAARFPKRSGQYLDISGYMTCFSYYITWCVSCEIRTPEKDDINLYYLKTLIGQYLSDVHGFICGYPKSSKTYNVLNKFRKYPRSGAEQDVWSLTRRQVFSSYACRVKRHGVRFPVLT